MKSQTRRPESHAGQLRDARVHRNADALGTLWLLEAIRILDIHSRVRFYQASTKELYGQVQEIPQRRQRRSARETRYGATKLYAYWNTVSYRKSLQRARRPQNSYVEGMWCIIQLYTLGANWRRGDALGARDENWSSVAGR